MEFWTSAETDTAAYPALTRARKSVEPYLNKAFGASSLASLNCIFRFVPIVMSEEARERYPARSKLNKKERTWDCCPQLNHDVFVRQDIFENEYLEAQIREYLREIAASGSQLIKLGATPEQIADFDKIMAAAVPDILAAKEKEAKDYRDGLKEKN
jgi:hypothetical protein